MTFPKISLFCTLTAIMLFLSGCATSRVYEQSKTVLIGGSMYNITDVKNIQSFVVGAYGTPPSEVDMKYTNRKQWEAITDLHGPVTLKMHFTFDGDEAVFIQKRTDSWREFSRLRSDFEKARERIAELMKDRKATQVKLR